MPKDADSVTYKLAHQSWQKIIFSPWWFVSAVLCSISKERRQNPKPQSSALWDQLSLSPNPICRHHPCSLGQDTTVCKPCVTHWALIKCYMSCATRHEGTGQLYILTELKLQSFLVLFDWLTPLNDEVGENTPTTKVIYIFWQLKLHPLLVLFDWLTPLNDERGEKTPDHQVQKMPHIKAKTFQHWSILKPTLQPWW